MGGEATGVGRCHGTFGELAQGVMPDGRHLMVTLPLARYSTARFRPAAAGGLVVRPAQKRKAGRLAASLLTALGLPPHGQLSLTSDLPVGKGLASSSADLVATARAVCAAWDRTIPPEALARLMAAIEPSDGVMFGGVVSFYHREGELRRSLGWLPPLTVVGLDEGGTVNTLAFNRRIEHPVHGPGFDALLARLEEAVRAGDLAAVGECATQSAIRHQEVLPKRHLELLLSLRRHWGALGVVVAHSGTYAGLLLDPQCPAHATRCDGLLSDLAPLDPCQWSTLGPEG